MILAIIILSVLFLLSLASAFHYAGESRMFHEALHEAENESYIFEKRVNQLYREGQLNKDIVTNLTPAEKARVEKRIATKRDKGLKVK